MIPFQPPTKTWDGLNPFFIRGVFVSALSAISTYSRVKQTARTWASMRYLAARELIERKEDFEEYVKASLPELQLNQVLTKQQNERAKELEDVLKVAGGER